MEKIESKFKDVEIVEEETEQIEEDVVEEMVVGYQPDPIMGIEEPMEELDDFDLGFDQGYSEGYADALEDLEVGDDYSIDAGVYESVKEESKNLLAEGKLEEAESVSNTIGTVIDTNWGGSNKEQLRAVQMLKFLATSDDELSNKFMSALDSATSKMKKDDFK